MAIAGMCLLMLPLAAETSTFHAQLPQLHAWTVLVNRVRLWYGAPPLKLNVQLCEAAYAYAEELVQHGRLSHVDAQGHRADYRVSAAGYFYWRLGENLAAGQPSWERAVRAWLNSPSHRANLLAHEYRELGIGHSFNDDRRYRTAWTQLLGTRRHVYPVVINLDAYATDTPEVIVYVHGAREAVAMRYRVDEGEWSEWIAPMEWFRCYLPAVEGWHTVSVQLQIGDRIFESSDEIWLSREFVEVAGERESNHERCAPLLEGFGASVECTTCGEHIVHQPYHLPLHLLGADDFKGIAHILLALHLAQAHLRASVETAAHRTLPHGDT